MEREEFMKQARMAANKILESKENGIMNLVQQAWAEGKRNAEVETLRAAIDEALDKREPKVEPKEDAVYPTWGEWFMKRGELVEGWENGTNPLSIIARVGHVFDKPIPADIAQELGIEPITSA